MPQDAFTLRHIARELDEMLAGGKVNKIIQPSRDEVNILLYAGGKEPDTNGLLSDIFPP